MPGNFHPASAQAALDAGAAALITGFLGTVETRLGDLSVSRMGRVGGVAFVNDVREARGGITGSAPAQRRAPGGRRPAGPAVAELSGMPRAVIPSALTGLRLISGRRMDVFDRADGVTVIDDSIHRETPPRPRWRSMRRPHWDGPAGRSRCSESAASILDGVASVRSWEGESVLVSDQAAAVSALRQRLRPGNVVQVKVSRCRTWGAADSLRVGA